MHTEPPSTLISQPRNRRRTAYCYSSLLCVCGAALSVTIVGHGERPVGLVSTGYGSEHRGAGKFPTRTSRNSQSTHQQRMSLSIKGALPSDAREWANVVVGGTLETEQHQSTSQ